MHRKEKVHKGASQTSNFYKTLIFTNFLLAIMNH